MWRYVFDISNDALCASSGPLRRVHGLMDGASIVIQFKTFPVTVRKPRTDLAIVAISGNPHIWETPNDASFQSRHTRSGPWTPLLFPKFSPVPSTKPDICSLQHGAYQATALAVRDDLIINVSPNPRAGAHQF